MFRLLAFLSVITVTNAREAEVRDRRTEDVKALVKKAGLEWPVDEIYLRAFKEEAVLELWGGARGKALTLIKTYPICAASGELGPKRKEGDLQVPEGLYEISEFNPASGFHLSMKVSYPNASDKVRSDQKTPGGLIYVHGNCASIGCIAIKDEPIEEVYVLSRDARSKPRIDIFPRRMSGDLSGPHADFWKELVPAYTSFEKTHRPARFTVDPKTGAYSVR